LTDDEIITTTTSKNNNSRLKPFIAQDIQSSTSDNAADLGKIINLD
jgi:hypothetical protein